MNWAKELYFASEKLNTGDQCRRNAQTLQKTTNLGSSDEFDNAIANFSMAYADQTQLDFEVLHRAIANNQITAYFEE